MVAAIRTKEEGRDTRGPFGRTVPREESRTVLDLVGSVKDIDMAASVIKRDIQGGLRPPGGPIRVRNVLLTLAFQEKEGIVVQSNLLKNGKGEKQEGT